jgi:hypothetical protein
MRIGIDLDNTLADYTRPFSRLCTEYGVDPQGQSHKNALRELLRSTGRKAEWTRLQGEIYGGGMAEATLARGAREFLARAACFGIDCFVVSHRTRRPISGGCHDLHGCARTWLSEAGLESLPTFLEESTSLKLRRIRLLRLTVFIDDLPEFLREAEFPTGVRRILLLSGGASACVAPDLESGSWEELGRRLLP